MSLADKLKAGFKNLGHAIAVGAKYLESAVVETVKVAQKVESLEPAAEAVIREIAGERAASFTDLAFHVFGDFVEALTTVNDDALQAIGERGLVVKTDVQVAKDVKAAADYIKKVLAAHGTPAPASPSLAA